MPDYRAMEREYLRLPHGRQRADAIREVYREADRHGDWMQSLNYRYEYLNETTFHVDTLELYIVFPEYMAIYDEHPELNIEPYDMMWMFKWVLGNSDKFYQISREDREKYLEEFRRRCEQYNYSLRTYYEFLRDYYVKFDKETALKASSKFDMLGRDDLSDCRACERSAECLFLLETDRLAAAEKRANPILLGTMFCAEIPHYTYDNFLEYYIKKLDEEKAREYERLAYKKACKEETMLDIISNCLLYCAIWEQERGVEHFEKHLPWYISARTPKDRMAFSRAAYALFRALAQKSTNDSITLRLPAEFELYNADGVYSLTALRDYFLSVAKDLTDKFDARNGHDYEGRMLSFVMSVFR